MGKWALQSATFVYIQRTDQVHSRTPSTVFSRLHPDNTTNQRCSSQPKHYLAVFSGASPALRPHFQSFEPKLTLFPTNRKTPWRLSSPQKARQRKRLRSVDRVVDTVSAALERNGQTSKAVTRWFAEMPREEEMLPKDKYTLFDKKEKSYRKSIHSMFSCHSYPLPPTLTPNWYSLLVDRLG